MGGGDLLIWLRCVQILQNYPPGLQNFTSITTSVWVPPHNVTVDRLLSCCPSTFFLVHVENLSSVILRFLQIGQISGHLSH